MSRSVVYRERDTEREWDEQPRKSYTTVKRYQVPESSTRSPVEDETTKEKITIRRERSAQPQARDDDYRYSERARETDRGRNDDSWDIKITERTRDSDTRDHDDYRYSERFTERDAAPRTNVSYRVVERDDYDDRRSVVRSDHRSDHRSDYRTDFRYTERDREVVRAPSPPRDDRVREFRFERERDFSPPERRRDDGYEVERYVKETDYYAPSPQPQPQPIIIRESRPPAPQPIIIREERRDPAPIIIREERREPQYEFIERKEVEEEKQLVKREEPPPPAPAAPPQQEEDYFYERRVREIERPRSRDHRSEIRPKDSASNYSSDDSYEYVRRERTYTDDAKDPHHKRHLAEGVIAGVAGAEILRHHRKSEGKDTGGRLKSALGGAIVGGVGAEALSRARSRHRSRAGSRSRSRSSSYDSRRDRRRRHKSRSRSRSRSKSISRKQLAGLAGVAAVGALAGYAMNKRNKNETVIVNDKSPPRRSRSRRRRGGSADSYMSGRSRSIGEDDKHRDPEHRNRRIAQAGLASAAAAGIWEKVRSKSRGGKDRERSKSRVRQAVPVVGAGLGGAALAGLWEKNKANKEAKRDKVIEDELGRGRRRRSRSRSRSVPAPYNEDRSNVDRRDMIAYGDDPVYSEDRGYYSDEEPGVYSRRRGGGSAASSPDNRQRGSSRRRSRSRGLAEAGAAAGVGALAAHEIGKRNDRRRNDRDRDRQRQDEEYYDDRYGPSPGPYSPEPTGYLPPQQNAGYPTQQQGYPGGAPYFAPPPTGENVYAHNQPYPNPQQQQAAYPPYNPQDYAQPGEQQTPYGNTRGAYSEANLGGPQPNDTFAGDPRYAAEEHPDEGRGRGHNPPPEHVSSAPVNGSNITTTNPNDDVERDAQDAGTSVPLTPHMSPSLPELVLTESVSADSVTTPRARSTSRVRFNLDANQMHSPETPKRRTEERFSDSETSGDRKRRHRRRKHRGREGEASRDSPQLMNDKYERAPKDDDSDVTEDLPDRFDEHGNPKQSGDPLEALIGNLAQRFLGGGSGGGEDDERHGRRRHRH